MSDKTLRLILVVILIFQIAFFAFGLYDFMQPDPLFKAFGVFIMLTNFVFGMINVDTLMKY